MIKRTKLEIEEKLKELWPNKSSYGAGNINKSVLINKDNSVTLSISGMYEPPGLSFAILKSLSEFFGTDDISDSRFSYSGCETCDYGADYGFELIIK